jgi:hypothetical protein
LGKTHIGGEAAITATSFWPKSKPPAGFEGGEPEHFAVVCPYRGRYFTTAKTRLLGLQPGQKDMPALSTSLILIFAQILIVAFYLS